MPQLYEAVNVGGGGEPSVGVRYRGGRNLRGCHWVLNRRAVARLRGWPLRGATPVRPTPGLVNEGESAQAQPLFVQDLKDGGHVRPANADAGAHQVREGL